MGIKSLWQNEVVLALGERGIAVEEAEHDIYPLLTCNGKVTLNLVPLQNKYYAIDLLALQKEYQGKGVLLLHVWEDVWLNRKAQVLGRISSLLGLNRRLHARKTSLTPITQEEADHFLEYNHIQASARARYKYALWLEGEMVAVACFSALRPMTGISPFYRSAELIRFATLSGFTVTGGFSKLLKHFIELMQPNDVMSYADRDWSLGDAYSRSGFVLADTTTPAEIWLQKKNLKRYFVHRLPADAASFTEDYWKIFNTGNLKYILYL